MNHFCGIVQNGSTMRARAQWGRAALTGRRESYPLVQARCAVSVVDVNVRATLTQTFVSASPEPQDVVYVFPLPSDAAVCAFTAVIDKARTIRGVVKEHEEAQREYDSAVKAGKTAALLRQHTSQVFQASLGNLKPGQTVEINIEFVSIIAYAGTLDSLRLRLPTTIAPFYGRLPASLKNTFSVGGPRFELSASFQMAGNITAITSDTHPIALNLGSPSGGAGGSFDPATAHVSLTSDGALTSNIVLELRCDGLDRPRCSVQRLVSPAGEVADALALTLVPRFAPAPLPAQEYLFLIDRSDSMDGARMRAVRAALHVMLRSLPSEGSAINLFSFGNKCSSLWPAAVPYCAESVDEAARHVERMQADLGGTEIADALAQVVQSRKRTTKEPAAVFVVTDGEAWDAQAVFKVVADAVAESDGALRVFVLGVGDQVSTEMCDGIARAGRGVATYVRELESPDAKLVGLLRAARSAPVEDLSVDWGVPAEPDLAFELVDADDADPMETVPLYSDAPAPPEPELGPADLSRVLPPPPALQQAPTHLDALPPLYPGFRHSVFALVRRAADAPLPTNISVRGTMRGAPVALDVPVVYTPSPNQPVPLLHVLAARALVQSLEDDGIGKYAAVTKARVVQLGTTYSIASKYTSFVAVDEAGERVVRLPGGFPAGEPPDETPSESEEEIYSGQDDAPRRRRGRKRLAVDFVQRASAGFVSDGAAESDDDMEVKDSDDDFELKDEDDDFELKDEDDDMEVKYEDQDDDDDDEMDEDDEEEETRNQQQSARAPAPASGVPLAAIAQAQAFDGSFPSLTALKLPATPAPPPGAELPAAVWNTVVALAVLQTRFGAPAQREAWSFIGAKARAFVLRAIATEAAAERVLEEWIAFAAQQLQPAA